MSERSSKEARSYSEERLTIFRNDDMSRSASLVALELLSDLELPGDGAVIVLDLKAPDDVRAKIRHPDFRRSVGPYLDDLVRMGRVLPGC
jgi:hypothetical protein